MPPPVNRHDSDFPEGKSWDRILAIQEIKDYFEDVFSAAHRQGVRGGFAEIITGESRAGKTSPITYLMNKRRSR